MGQYGRIRLDNLLWLELSLLITIPLYTYYVAVYKDGIDPFPHTTVTNTACPYPQNIVFRFGMLTAASFLALTFFCIFKWLKYISIKSQWPGHIPNIAYIISQFIILPYTIAIGTIDSAGTKDIHDISAVIFFIGLLGVTLYITFKVGQIRNWDASVISRESWVLKQLACIYLISVWIYCLIQLLTNKTKPSNDFIVIVEWNTVIVNLLWLLSFRTEWRKVYLTFNGKSEDFLEIAE